MGFIIFALIIAGVGAFFQYCQTDRTKNARPYTAEVISLQSHIKVRRGITYTVYKPLVKYSDGEKEHKAEHFCDLRPMDCPCEQGGTTTIFADPRLPKVFFFEYENRKLSLEAVVCFAAAALCLVLGLIMETAA